MSWGRKVGTYVLRGNTKAISGQGPSTTFAEWSIAHPQVQFGASLSQTAVLRTHQLFLAWRLGLRQVRWLAKVKVHVQGPSRGWCRGKFSWEPLDHRSENTLGSRVRGCVKRHTSYIVIHPRICSHMP